MERRCRGGGAPWCVQRKSKMPKDKDLKRLIRARMAKTGESYTAARAQLVSEPAGTASGTPQLLPDDYEKVAGMSDAAVSKSTGKTWPEWSAILDGIDAVSMKHKAIADHLYANHEISGWWAQMVTVAYERFRGLRDVGRRRGGGYDMNKSKTIGVSVSRLYSAFEDPALRDRWLPDVDLTIRTATEDKSMRCRLADAAALDVYFSAKGDAKSTVSLQRRNLPDRGAAEDMKLFWGERLDGLKQMLLEA